MSEIKILQEGLTDYEESVKKISNKFIDLNNLEYNMGKKLTEKHWQGVTRDKCELLLTLTQIYRKKIQELMVEMNQKELELKQNIDTFSTQSSAIKSL
jgi:hypothetical protein